MEWDSCILPVLKIPDVYLRGIVDIDFLRYNQGTHDPNRQPAEFHGSQSVEECIGFGISVLHELYFNLTTISKIKTENGMFLPFQVVFEMPVKARIRILRKRSN